MFRLPLLGHYQVVSHDGGNYTIHGMIKYVTMKIIMIQRDLVLSIKVSNTALVFHQAQTCTFHYRSTSTQKK